MGRHPTVDYLPTEDVHTNKLIIAQQHLRSNMISLCIKKPLTSDTKFKLRYFKTSYTYNNQDYGSAMFFVIVNFVCPDTHEGLSDINTNMETMRMSNFNHDITKANLQIAV